MLRSSNRPLARIAKRLMESSKPEYVGGRHDDLIDEYISPEKPPKEVFASKENSGYNIPEDLKSMLMGSHKSIHFFFEAVERTKCRLTLACSTYIQNHTQTRTNYRV